MIEHHPARSSTSYGHAASSLYAWYKKQRRHVGQAPTPVWLPTVPASADGTAPACLLPTSTTSGAAGDCSERRAGASGALTVLANDSDPDSNPLHVP